jgi:NAD(P)-dependent dehydrogenase (short-subunit alcohol dehydrogenase family)
VGDRLAELSPSSLTGEVVTVNAVAPGRIATPMTST